jgi:hypothetical protein
LQEENILYCKMIEDLEVQVEDVEENFQMAMSLVKGNRFTALVDARLCGGITKEAMDRAHQPESYTLLIAQAIVVDSLPNRLIANFIIKFHKPSAPTKLFSTPEAGLTWLHKQIIKERKEKNKRRQTMLW